MYKVFKFKNICIAAIMCFLLSSFSLRAQQSDSVYTLASFAEKVYLQFDSKVYITGQTVWFKAIVANAADHTPTLLSKVLYVELIDAHEQLVERKLLKVEAGIAAGFFHLSENYKAGAYQIRAYTKWDKNFGTDFLFIEYINVFAAVKDSKPSSVRNITVSQGVDKKRRLSASFYPAEIDSLHQKDLPVFIALGNRTDTVILQKNDLKSYLLDYSVPDSCQFITMKFVTKSSIRFAKTIIVDKDYTDLQFFPESGEMVHGMPALLGFKALDSSNKGKKGCW